MTKKAYDLWKSKRTEKEEDSLAMHRSKSLNTSVKRSKGKKEY